ncbi:MAG: hypothetical protein IT365_23985 [Candidatus Hydrogenedentes bacterium]|nr:hypothetical protein [Candidatus Hydrogenedentota bacterium]
MKDTRSLQRLFAVTVVIVALSSVSLTLGVTATGHSSIAFEYKVFSQTTLIKSVTLEMVKQREGTQPPASTDFVQQSIEGALEMSKQVEAALNDLGSEGWELAGVTDSFCILKRAKR